MDRVLLVIDDIQYCRHVEMTLRKMGFDVESINNEFNLSDSVLTYNPDYIVCKGNSSRLSAVNVGKKLKESNLKFSGKVILILANGVNLAPDELIKLKMDLLFFEPMSTLKLAISLFSLTGGEVEFVKDKMLKFAITDTQFRNFEQQLLRSAGITLDSEIETISEMNQFSSSLSPSNIPKESRTEASAAEKVKKIQIERSESAQKSEDIFHLRGERTDDESTQYVQRSSEEAEVSGIQPDSATESADIEVTGRKLMSEVADMQSELPLRIDSYNRAINNVDQNLNNGLKKRQTKLSSNKLRKDLIAERKTDIKLEEEQDEARMRFARALFKK